MVEARKKEEGGLEKRKGRDFVFIKVCVGGAGGEVTGRG